jgi:hypothetical protein
VAQYELLPAHTDWRWTEPALLRVGDYEEIPPVEYGHTASVSTWRDEESGVLVARVRLSNTFTVCILYLLDLYRSSFRNQMSEIFIQYKKVISLNVLKIFLVLTYRYPTSSKRKRPVGTGYAFGFNGKNS